MTNLIPLAQVDLEASLTDATGQLSARSKRIYKNDTQIFARWLIENGLTPESFTRSHAIAYRAWLDANYEKATAQRMLSVARRILAEQVNLGKVSANPLQGVKGFKTASETTHTALTKQQAKELLTSIDRSTPIGKRDYALISILLRTGIRRSECAALMIGDVKQEQGHTVAIIQHGKGDKRRIVKIPVDVFRSIKEYIEEVKRQNASPEEPLFIGLDRWGNISNKKISDKLIERVVKHYGEIIGVPELTPHGLRATFITLSLEGGAALWQVQYAAGHDQPGTTERYHKRKVNLDDNAVDYIKL